MRAVRGVSSDVKGEAMMRMNQAHTPVTSKAFTEREAAIRENELARQMYPNMESAMAEVDQHGNNSPYVAKARVLAALLDGDDGAKEVLQRKGVATDMPLEVIAIAQKYSKDREGRRPTL
ncbi:hypothetical protein FRB97_001662 [Tulasnella sp. 331]|nr:hypothetical protein FRB97_001662 [Tulasnella sp. 331]